MAGAKKKQKTAAAVGQSAVSAKPQESDKSEFLKLFWPLAESERAARTLAASRILAHLKRNDAQLQYTLKRLVRGLASSRDAARQGFSAALAGLLREFEAVELRQTRELLHEAMEVHASMRGMEQREHMFGRLFGLLALHRSGRLEKDRELQVQVAKELLEMAAWKKWFREACFEAALDVISRVPSDVFVEELAATIAALLPTGDKEWNADQVLLAVGVQHYLAAQGIATSQIKDVENADIFNVVRRKHMHALAEPLRMSAGSYPRVHSAWMCVFGHILHTGTADKEIVDGELFQEAWTVLVENALLGGAATENGEITGATTHARRGIAFKLLELAAPRLPRPLLRAVLTPRLVKCLYNNSVAKKNYLHDAARHCIKAFAIHARAECVHFFAKQFVSPMPTLLETSADAEDEEEKQEQKKEQQEAIKRGGFDAIIAIEEEKERAEQRQKRLDSVRLWAIDAIIIALTESLSKESSEESTALGFNVDDALRFVVGHALFAPAGSTSASKKSKKKKSAKKSEANNLLSELGAPTPAISSTVVSYSKKRMFALLGLGLSGSADASAISKSVLARVYAISQSLLGEEVPLRKPLEDESEQLTAMSELVTSIVSTRLPSEEDASKRQQLEAFDLLLMSTSVQLLDAEQREEASVVATDLRKCFTELLESKKAAKKSSKKKKKQDEDEEESDKPDSIVVLTDMLLSLLSQDSSAMREIVNHVFRSILPLLNAASLATMVNVLAPSPEGEDEAHHDEEDEDEDMGEEEEEEEEEIVLSSAEDVSAALRSDEKLAALHREDLTLAAIVGQVKDKAQRKKDAQKLRLQHMHFQLRVLDLLQVFATSSATKDASHLVVSIVRPLIEALAAVGARDTERRVLRERLESVLLHKVLRSKDSALLGDSKEAASVESEAFESLEAIVKMLSTRTLDKDHAGKVAAASVVYFVRVLCGSAELKAATLDKRVTRVAEILAPVVTETFTKKHSRFPRSVFDELVTKLPGVSVRVLLAPLTAIAAAKDGEEGAALDEFSQGEVFRLLTLLSRPKLLPSGSKELEVFTGARATLTAAATRVVSEHAPKKANRLKLVLQFVLQLVKAWGATAEQQKAKALKPLVAALEGLESPSPAVRGIAKQALAAAAVGEPQSKPEEQEEDLMPEKKAKAKSADAKKKRKRAD